MRASHSLMIFAVLVAGLLSATGTADTPPVPAAKQRACAVTFDDLPATRDGVLADIQEITARTLEHLRREKIPAIGFVNERKLERSGEEEARRALLSAWLDAGHDLGNHTHGHVRFYDTPLAEYEADVLKGERVTRPLMSARGRTLKYFRHPMLNTGPDLPTKRAFERFLSEHGYVIAPVTMDNDEYLYAAAYDHARGRNDRELMERLERDYLRYMREVFAFCERLSVETLGREIPQVLLLHVNALNAARFPDLAAELRNRGYRFITLEEALRDPAYQLPDDYVGPYGPSWLKRWAVTRGAKPSEPGDVPEWVARAATGK